MPLSSRAAVAALLITISAPAALAQAPAAPPAASAPGGTYRPAFEGYRRFSEQPLAPWKDSNDRVAEIGGWKAYAREAAGAGQAASPAAPAASAAAGHPGHHDHRQP